MSTADEPPPRREPSIYNRPFWLAFLANLTLVTANAFTFRFAELVAYLGGTEKIAGGIVATGLGVSLASRFYLGTAIDHHGARRIWLLMSLLLMTGASLFITCQSIGPLLIVARIFYAVGIAGVAACSIVHIQNLVPPHRRTEIIGSLGASGFIGMVIGAHAGDWILNHIAKGRPQFVVLFGCTAILTVVYLLIVMYLTKDDEHTRPQEMPAVHKLLLRHWPGFVVVVAMLMGMGLTIPTVFLTRYATWLKSQGVEIHGIGVFFTGYTLSAFIFRISGSRWNGSIGRHRMILAGLAGHAVGYAMLPFVRNEWHFILPSITSGFGHAMLFPAVVSMGAGAFPPQYRGTGTTIILGFLEVGTMLSAPLLGWIIDHVGFAAMFTTTSLAAVLVGVVYALTEARHPDRDRYTILQPEMVEATELAIDAQMVQDLAEESVALEPRPLESSTRKPA